MNNTTKQNEQKDLDTPDDIEKDSKNLESKESSKNNSNDSQQNNVDEETEYNEEKISDLTNELESFREEKLRLLAEMENLRKRSDREKIDSIKYGSVNLARDILSLNDNLARALDSISDSKQKDESIKNLVEGLKMAQREFMTTLEVKKIESMNQKFDHNYHQAMLEVETSEVDEGIVVQEIQKGFTMHERLLRPSMVGVSKKPKNKRKEPKNQ